MVHIQRFVGFTFALISFFLSGNSQNLYDLNTVQKIEITFTQPDWDYRMDTAKHGQEDYLMAAQVVINGTSFDSVGVKYKGNSSFDSTQIKNPLHIELNTFKGHKYNGHTDIKLSNGYADPSLIREVLAYQILKSYMHCPSANFAQVYINGNYIGLYSSAENINKNFCADHFYSSQNTFIKCNPTVNPGPATKSNLKFIDNDSSSYSILYEIKSDYGWNDLVKLCDSVSNNTSSLDNMLDMDRVIWMLAFNNVLINLDSYSGVFAQNHYAYRDHTGRYNPIIWDLNMSFGGFPFAGAGTSSMGAQTIAMLQQFSPDNHSTDPNWPLIQAVQNNPTYKKKYIAHMRTLLDEYFVSNTYVTLATQLMNLIDTAVQSDNNKFFTYSQFNQSLDSLVDFGSYDVPGIRNLMDARKSYLLSLSAFSASTPSISGITSSTAAPVIYSTFHLTATVSNATSNGVTLGYRFDKKEKFIKVAMFDDGLHNDGAAGDNVFGASLVMNGGEMQYYIYAENANAGIFSPQRAEHEFHSLMATSQAPAAGQLVINELLADNSGLQRDEYDDTEDWIELYNNSTQLLNLSDVYLSDKTGNLLLWKFPPNTTIAPNAYLTIWADDDSSEQIYHTNFQLNKDSGVVLLSTGSGSILDSISFAAQTTNVSFGRYPNGTGSFIPMNTTYGAYNTNYPLQLVNTSTTSFRYYPNPANEQLIVEFKGEQLITLYSLTGHPVRRVSGQDKARLDVQDLSNGLYFIRCGNETGKVLISH